MSMAVSVGLAYTVQTHLECKGEGRPCLAPLGPLTDNGYSGPVMVVGVNNGLDHQRNPLTKTVLLTEVAAGALIADPSAGKGCKVLSGTQGATATRIGDYVFVFGGRTKKHGTLNTLFRYTIQSKEWISLSSGQRPKQRMNHSAFTLGGMLYVAGGYSSKRSPALRDCWEFNPDTSVWRRVSDAPVGFESACVVTVGDAAHVMGGVCQDMHLTFDGTSWSQETPLPFKAHASAAVCLGTDIHVMGGTHHGRQVHMYNTQTREWWKGDPLPVPFDSGSACVLNDSTVYVVSERSLMVGRPVTVVGGGETSTVVTPEKAVVEETPVTDADTNPVQHVVPVYMGGVGDEDPVPPDVRLQDQLRERPSQAERRKADRKRRDQRARDQLQQELLDLDRSLRAGSTTTYSQLLPRTVQLIQSLERNLASTGTQLSETKKRVTVLEQETHRLSAVTAERDSLMEKISDYEARFNAFSPFDTERASATLASVSALNTDGVGYTLDQLAVFTPSVKALLGAAESLKCFMEEHPIDSLASGDVTPLLTSFTPLSKTFHNSCAQLEGVKVDPTQALGRVQEWLQAVTSVCALLPIIPPAPTAAMSLDVRTRVCTVVKYNCSVTDAYTAVEVLMPRQEDLQKCVDALAGVDLASVAGATAIASRVQDLHQRLLQRGEEEKDMKEVIMGVKALPQISLDRLDEVEESLELNAVRIRRARSQRARDTLEAESRVLQNERDTIMETMTRGRGLMTRLQRHSQHPEAAEVLRTRYLRHPLDTTRLAPFCGTCLDIPFHQFKPVEFPSAGRLPMYEGVYPESNLPVVLKEYNLDDITDVEHARREVSVYQTVRDVLIVRFMGLVVEGLKCYLVTEKYDCNLMQYLRAYPEAPIETRRHIVRQLLLAMAVLEGHRVVHRDIKPQNVFLKHSEGVVSSVALGDFDISKNSQDYVTTLRRTICGTMHYIDSESASDGCFDSLSDVYSFGRTVEDVFSGPDRGFGQARYREFACPDLTAREVSAVRRCLGSKKNRISAYHMAAAGLFAQSAVTASSSPDAVQRLEALAGQTWVQVQGVKAQAESVPCSPESLVSHFNPGDTASIEGYCRLSTEDPESEEQSPLMRLVCCLQQPVGKCNVPLLERAGLGEYQLVPSICGCTLMQDSTCIRDSEYVKDLRMHYAALGRFLAFQLLDGPLPHGLFGMVVYAAMHGGIDTFLKDEAAVSRVFASTFPIQRRSLLRTLANLHPVPFTSIPGVTDSDKVLSKHNSDEFATLFETSYVRLMMVAGREIHRGYCSLHAEWASTVSALSLDQFVKASASVAPISASQYKVAFVTESSVLRQAFDAFVDAQIGLESDTLLRLLLVFATGSSMLPQRPITLVLAENSPRLALPSAHQCSSSVTVPDCCLANLDLAFQDSCDAVGITIGDGRRAEAVAVERLNQSLTSFRELSDTVHTCPGCGVAVNKTAGCNHMHCHCGKHWCWKCGYVSSTQGPVYRHLIKEHGGY
ncbi:hypothetical protein KIPB_002364 [Kipferlia bialata]|uniref:Protein kinase domain-containing protein n=1 Tax=Kipferlia bialata TaxID=797122 RepID=A0A9K3CSC6_9EUKA|nr:hypothetical protein KIPB_002364 [Kipferlia bialata]|eukprot:g2364.t1